MQDNLDRRLNAVSGYIDLGMTDEAGAMLDSLDARLHSRPEVMVVRVELHLATERWAEAATDARRLTERMRDEPQHWIWLAYATRRAESVAAAEAILTDALEHHPEVAIIHYNLACYAAVEGRLDEAHARLREAVSLDPRIAALATSDPDLENLRRDQAG